MERIINRLIIEGVEGCDVYHHNKSTWLIFTDTKQWVVELTNGGTLWYNYSFFNNLFQYVSLDVIENQQYITKWMESFIKNGVKQTIHEVGKYTNDVENTIKNGSIDSVKVSEYSLGFVKMQRNCEDTIKNGVKTAYAYPDTSKVGVEDAIDNGVKETNPVDVMKFFDNKMEEVLQNGIKNTQNNPYPNESWIEGVIKKGVKHTEDGDWLDGDVRLDDIIENGVKETHDDAYHHKGRIDGVINNGVKEIYSYKGFRPRNIGDIIENGVKETQPLPEQSGELRGYGDYYDLKEDRTKAFIDYLVTPAPKLKYPIKCLN